MASIENVAGEVIAHGFGSEAEACRWYQDSGRSGDRLHETGELMSTLMHEILGVGVTFDGSGQVV